jgi:hypothetical protein
MGFMYRRIVLFRHLRESHTWRSVLGLELRHVLDRILLLQPVSIILLLLPLLLPLEHLVPHLFEVIMPAPGMLLRSYVLGGGVHRHGSAAGSTLSILVTLRDVVMVRSLSGSHQVLLNALSKACVMVSEHS